MKFFEKFRTESLGFYVILGAVLVGLITTIIYLVFGVLSHTFEAAILLCLLFGSALGLVHIFYKGFFGDFVNIAMIVLFTVSLGCFILNSIGDFTEMITPVGMYGNADNMGMRYAILVMMGISILVTIAGSFMVREKKK